MRRSEWPVRVSRLGDQPRDDQLPVPFPGRSALVRNRKASGRAKELADLEAPAE